LGGTADFVPCLKTWDFAIYGMIHGTDTNLNNNRRK